MLFARFSLGNSLGLRNCSEILGKAHCSSVTSVDLQYDDYNDASEPHLTPLLVSHGMLGSRQNWTSIAKHLHKTTGKIISVGFNFL